jgi:hypothetical protein
MSIEVLVASLFDDIDRWGFGYLVTVSDDGRAHVLALFPENVDNSVLRFDVGGGRASRNAAGRSDVTIVFPPADAGGMTLIVDGHATVSDESIDVVPARAVLHRQAPRVSATS